MVAMNERTLSRIKRRRRIRKRIRGTSDRPRLSVFRSAKHIYAQVIDDVTGNTLASASSTEKAIREELKNAEGKGKIKVSVLVGKLVAQRVKEKGIGKVVFDRNGFLYHGRVKAVSDGARKEGLEF